MMRTRLVLLMLAAALLAACILLGFTSIRADEMQWETNGGGQITFSVRRNDPGFDVQVTSYRYDDRDDRFTITPDAGEVYSALVRVMRNQRKVRRSISIPGLTTGTWTTLQFSDGKHTRTVEDVVLWAQGDAKVIYDYVTAQIEAGGQ